MRTLARGRPIRRALGKQSRDEGEPLATPRRNAGPSSVTPTIGGAAMSTSEDRSSDVSDMESVKNVDLKLEVVVLPVSDVERAKAFYGGLGWRLDADFSFDNGFRVVQFTPPGSDASIQFGRASCRER